MKKLILKITLLSVLFAMVSCSDIEPLIVDKEAQMQLLERDKKKWAEEDSILAQNKADSIAISEENKRIYQLYLQDLRDYKKSDHLVMFGWFAYWNPTSPDPTFSLDHLPDSVDFVSNWGAWNNLDQVKKNQLMQVQEKGTRVTIGWIIENVGDGINGDKDFWPDDPYEAIEAYAQAIVDSIAKYNYDGMDIDYEPSYASPFKPGMHCGDWSDPWAENKALISCSQYGNKEYENYFFRTMREKLGPDKLLNINGSIHWLDPEVAHLFDYFVPQSYNNTASRWTSTIMNHLRNAGVKENQIIYTETFQTNKINADNFVTNYADYVVNQLNGNAGGIGAFHINEDYLHGPDYKNVKAAIRKMNPPIID